MVSVTTSLNVPSHPSAQLTHRGTARSTQSSSAETASPTTEDSTAGTSSTTSAATTGNDAAADFAKLFCSVQAPDTSTPVVVNSTPTAQSVFGDNPWVTNPTGVGPAGTYSFNPMYFATPQTAQKVAQMLGGTVVESNQLVSGGNFAQQQPNEMVELPNGHTVNAGLVAGFYTHGYPQSYIDQLIASTVSNT